ncbi:unnamed protein product [Peniophora sp. CBMAI 1063]|nr:unnamed protein product [Peniophora sp. CBMAI 1063]
MDESAKRHINDLPFELLQEILVCAAFLVDEHPTPSFMGQRYDDLDPARASSQAVWNWLDVMAVCKLWRTAANESPQFHSRVALQNAFAMRRSLALSHGVPLRIISGRVQSWMEFKMVGLEEALGGVLPRVCEIDLVASPDAFGVVQAVMITILSNPAPLLRRLRARYLPGVDGPALIDAEQYEPSDRPLRDLTLTGLQFSKRTSFFPPSLRSLSLTQCHLFEDAGAQTLCDLLGSLPDLEVIDFRDTVLADLAEPIRVSLPTHPTHLQRLRRLTLDAPYMTVHRFLGLITFPTTTSVELSLQSVTSALLTLGPPDALLGFLKRHVGAASESGSGYTRVGTHLDVSPYHGELSYAWTFSRPHNADDTAVLPGSMTVKWTFSVKRHYEFPVMAGYVKFVIELIPHANVPHTLHVLQSGSFARWRREGEELNEYDCWFTPYEVGLESTVELWFAGGAILDALYWFANNQRCGGWSGRSDYPTLKVLGFRNPSMYLDESLIGERDGQIEGVVRRHPGKNYAVKFWNCEVPDQLRREMVEVFGCNLEIIQ